MKLKFYLLLFMLVGTTFLSRDARAARHADVERIIPRRVFDAAGLSKLSPRQLSVLTAWLGGECHFGPRRAGSDGVGCMAARPGLDCFSGAIIEADDGTFLGKLGRSDEADSLANPYGAHSAYSSRSILNNLSAYGNRYSDTSAHNPSATRPPYLIHQDTIVGRITTNPKFHSRIHPDMIVRWVEGRRAR